MLKRYLKTQKFLNISLHGDANVFFQSIGFHGGNAWSVLHHLKIFVFVNITVLDSEEI